MQFVRVFTLCLLALLATMALSGCPVDAPVAAFDATPRTGEAPLTVTFSNASTGAASHAWTFGDGGSATEASPAHTYTAPGSYTVSLTVNNETGSDTETKTAFIVVSDDDEEGEEEGEGVAEGEPEGSEEGSPEGDTEGSPEGAQEGEGAAEGEGATEGEGAVEGEAQVASAILFVTQTPLGSDFANIMSTFGTHKGNTDSAPRGGDLYIRYADGTVSLVKADPKGYEEVSAFKVPGSGDRPSWAHMVILDGRLYLREGDRILCYDLRAT